MTIVAIEVLLHYYYSPEAYPRSAPAIDLACSTLIGDGLLVHRQIASEHGSKFDVTEKGRVWVEAIRNLPLPVQVSTWTIPECKQC